MTRRSPHGFPIQRWNSFAASPPTPDGRSNPCWQTPPRCVRSWHGRFRPRDQRPTPITRTTAVTTTLRGAPAHNVIPTSASAAVNIRILVGDTVESVLGHVTKAVNDDQVSISVHDANEPSPVSPVDDSAFRLLEQCVEQVFPDAVATPYVVMGATDARHFHAICDRVYRFTPFRMSKPQRALLHSDDEHLGVEDFTAGIRWYRHLIEAIPS